MKLPDDPAENPAGSGDATLDSTPSSASSASPSPSTGSKSIGPYHLVRKLGQGGMGQVWLAEQTVPFHRQVALKLIKAGLFDDSLLQRFQAERQSLAIMNHPSIAKVFDAGATSDGQPYFVMEYVAGPPITDYCDQNKLKIHERLELFVKVCEGVQHAHQKAIIHRDLKPANILVVDVDGKPTPRIIDFGIAKAVSSQSTDELSFTRFDGGFVGTPGYMSPEQADSSTTDIDTRTDVYSLGVILYVLLTGLLPHDSVLWKQKSLDEIFRQLREEDPLRPSTKISTSRDTQETTAHLRHTEPQQLVTLLRGDLDWITMKAIEKERDRRYATPSELGADIERYLQNRPVIARPASTAYRLGKYLRRHRVAAAVLAGLAVVIVAFAINEAIQVRRITRERDRADRVAQFMGDMFRVSDPSEARGNSITVREILDKASREIDTGLARDPQLQAQMMGVMGSVYQNLGLYAQAHTLLAKSVGINSKVLGRDDPETLTSVNALVSVLAHEGRYAEAEKLARENLDLTRRIFGPKHRNTIKSMQTLGLTLEYTGKYEEAEPLERESLKLAQASFSPDDPDLVKFVNNVALVETRRGRLTEGEKVWRDAIESERQTLGPDHPLVLVMMNNLAVNLQDQGRFPEAEKIQRDLLSIEVHVLGPEHPDTLMASSNLSNSISDQGRYAEAEKLQRENLEIQRRVLGPEHPETLRTMDNLANAISEQGRHAEAEQLVRETIELRKRINGPDSELTAASLYDLACILALDGRPDEAFSALRESMAHGLSPRLLAGLSSDSDLQSLHSDPRFPAVLADAKKRLASTAQKP